MDDISSDKIKQAVQNYANEKGFLLNSDQKQLQTILKGLVRNTEKYGYQYCPCRIRTGDPKKDKDIICPCVYHQDEIRTEGKCHCNLFFARQ